MREQHLNTVEYIAIDTDEDCLNRLLTDITIKIEKGFLYKDEIEESEGRYLYESFKDNIQTALLGTDFVFIIGVLGSQTGSVAMPLVASIAKWNATRVIALVYTLLCFKGKSVNEKLRVVWLFSAC